MMVWSSVVGIKDQKWPGCHLFGIHTWKRAIYCFLGNLGIFKYFLYKQKLQMRICMSDTYLGGGE